MVNSTSVKLKVLCSYFNFFNENHKEEKLPYEYFEYDT